MDIREYMEKHELSQGAFGKLIGVSQSMVSQWLNGTRPISPESAVLIEDKTRGQIKRHELRPDIFERARAA